MSVAPRPAALAIALAAPLVAGALLIGRGDAASPAPRLVRVGAGREVATGFVAGRGRLVTVAHVLAAGGVVRVGGARARVVRVDRRDDLAVLSAPGLDGSLRRATPHPGEDVTLRVLRGGHTRSLRATVRRTVTAHVRPLAGPVQVRPALELRASVQPGDSGAPVLDADGRLVGVVFAQATGRPDVTWAVDARAVGP